MMIRLWLLTALYAVIFSFNSYGQTFVIEGTVSDSVNQATLENVVAELVSQNKNQVISVAVTNARGNFSLSVPAGNYLLVMRLLGYSLLSTPIRLESNLHLNFLLKPQPVTLGEVEVTSMMVNRQIKDLPTPISVIGSYKYQRLSSQTLSDVIATEPGISMGSDGIWATNVNVRGMNESRLVTLIDGNRVETATDLTASFSMTDVNDIERVEVVKGAQSSIYGTGAMGGIVNIITKDGHFADKPYISGNLISGYASANGLINTHADMNTGSDKWYFRLSGSYGKAGNIRTPIGTLPNSGFTTHNVAARFGVRPFKDQLFTIQYQRNWSKDVGIPGGSAFPGPAVASYTDIGRQLLSADYEISNISGKFKSLKLSYFNQYIWRNVAMVPNTVTLVPTPTGSQRITPELITPVGDHYTQGGKLQGTWNLSEKNTLISGIDIWSRKLTTAREKYIRVDVLNSEGTVIKTNNLVRGETPIPESRFTSSGIFIQDETRLLDDRMTLIFGGRLDNILEKNARGFDIDYLITNGVRNDTPANQRITFEAGKSNAVSWSSNAGVLYRIFGETDLSVNVARSFRSPSLEERFKYIDLGNYVRLGNPDLKPESGYSTDLGLRIWKPAFNFQADIFANRILNMIVESPGEFIYTINTGASEGQIDTLPALVNSNVSKAMLYGIDFGFQYNFYSDFVLYGSGAFVRGRDTEAGEDLPQIPPLNGRLGIRYTFKRIGSVDVTAVGAIKQDRIAEGEKETGGYSRLDLSVSSEKINIGPTRLGIFAGIDNVTDRSYTNHLSTNRGSISVEPGRNIYLRLNLAF